jgi:hypothetical protein
LGLKSEEEALRLKSKLCRLDAGDFAPGLGHEGVAGEGGVDSVAGPVFGFGAGGDGVVEHGLEGDPEGLVFLRDFFGGGAELVELGEPGVFDGSAAKGEGFADDDGGVGELLFGVFDEGVETIAVGGDGAVVLAVHFVPHVVDADEDGEDGGLEVEGVFLPAGLELGDFVSADAAVEDLEVEAGVGPEEIAADKEGVAASEGSLVVGLVCFLAAAAGVGDGVALEEDDVAFFEGGLCWFFLGGGGLEEGGSGGEGGGGEEMASFHKRVYL